MSAAPVTPELLARARQVWRAHCRRTGDTPDLAWDNAVDGLLAACASHDPARGRNLISWVGYKVERYLQDGLRNRLGRPGRRRQQRTVLFADYNKGLGRGSAYLAEHGVKVDTVWEERTHLLAYHDRTDRGEDFEELLRPLHPRLRLLLTLLYDRGLLLREAADILGVGESAVCRMRQTALARLRRLYY